MGSSLGSGDLAAEQLRRETDLDRIAARPNWGPLYYRLDKHRRSSTAGRHSPAGDVPGAVVGAMVRFVGSRSGRSVVRIGCRSGASSGLAWSRRRRTTARCAASASGLMRPGWPASFWRWANAQIEAKGLMLKRGTLIDATIVETAAAKPAPGSDAAEHVDPDAAFLKREGKAGSSYGYKAHVAVDQGSLLVRSAQSTPANVAETMVADYFIAANSDGGAIYADKAYDTHQRRDLGLVWAYRWHHAPAEQASSADDATTPAQRRSVEDTLRRRNGVRGSQAHLWVPPHPLHRSRRNQLQLTLLAHLLQSASYAGAQLRPLEVCPAT